MVGYFPKSHLVISDIDSHYPGMWRIELFQLAQTHKYSVVYTSYVFYLLFFFIFFLRFLFVCRWRWFFRSFFGFFIDKSFSFVSFIFFILIYTFQLIIFLLLVQKYFHLLFVLFRLFKHKVVFIFDCSEHTCHKNCMFLYRPSLQRQYKIWTTPNLTTLTIVFPSSLLIIFLKRKASN